MWQKLATGAVSEQQGEVLSLGRETVRVVLCHLCMLHVDNPTILETWAMKLILAYIHEKMCSC